MLYHHLLALLEEQGGSPHQRALCLNNLASLSCRTGNYKEAESLCQRALAILEQGGEPNNATIKTIRANYNHILILISLDDAEE
jgi:hypothetical protein